MSKLGGKRYAEKRLNHDQQQQGIWTEYVDVLSSNSEGEGFVIQPWVLALTPGRISWRVISESST